MPVEFSAVTDNALLPFANSGAIAIPRGDDNVSGNYSLNAIFEEGFLFGTARMTSLRIATNGQIYFWNV